jgi:hypothetical protein
MKHNKILLILASCCLILASCVKDGSNYDYVDVNDIQISGIEPTYTINMLDTLRITPVLEGVLGNVDEGNLEFLWDIFEGLNNLNRFTYPDTLSTERNLDIPITYIPGAYRISYKVTDKTTGVRYRYEFPIQVMSEFQRGILTLSEVDNNAVVSFMSITGANYPNVYYNINGEHAGTNPIAIEMMGRSPLDYVAVICDDARGGVFLSTVSFAKMYEYSEYFYNTPPVIKPQAFMTQLSYGTGQDYQHFVNRSYLVNDNKLYMKDMNHTVSVDGVTEMVENKFYDAYTGDYEIAKERFQMVETIHFDNKHKRFMYVPNINQPNLYVVQGEPENIYFDPADVGMELVWGRMCPSPRGQILVNSLFKRPNGKYTFLRWRANFPAAGRVQPLQKVEMPDEWQIHNSTVFAGNLRQDYIYFAVGSRLYVYDRVANQERMVYEFSGNVVIDQIMYHEAIMSEEIMWVATSAPGQGGLNGSLHQLDVGPGGVMTLAETRANVAGKVVSMCWKN